MKKRSAFVCRDSAAGILPVVCAVVAGLLGFAQYCDAQGTAPVVLPSVQFSSGMAGLASGQTARLNVVNIGPTTASPIACVLVLAFLDSDGKILKQMVASVALGKAAFMHLAANTTVWGARLEIRGIGYNPLLSPVAVPQPVSCNLVPTLDVLDQQTSKTAAILADFRTSTTRHIATPALATGQR